LRNKKDKLQVQLEEVKAQIQECHDAINVFSNNNGIKTEEYTHQDFVNIACTLIQDKPGIGQRKTGVETPELISELEIRSKKVKTIVLDLDKET